jgi:DNA-binding transcriptional regulator YhcF (GntR family)
MLDYLLLVGRVVHSLATDGHFSELRDSKLAVFLTTLSFLNGESGYAEASVRAIAVRADIPESTVYRVLNELEQGGYLTRENKRLSLGHKLTAAVEAHARRARPVNNSSVLEQSSTTVTSVELTEHQLRAATRKRTQLADIRQMVLRYGSEHVDRAVLEMLAQYPSDELVRVSFGALVRRACEQNWVSQKRDQVIKTEHKAQEAQQGQAVATDEAKVLIDPDDVVYPILRRLEGFVVVQAGVDGAGVPKELVIPARDWPLFRWTAG